MACEGRIAREPDGLGFFGHIVELPKGSIVELGDGFETGKGVDRSELLKIDEPHIVDDQRGLNAG